MTASSSLPEVVVDGRRYVGVPLEQAADIGACVRRVVTPTARNAGVDESTVPLLATAVQLALAHRAASSSVPGTRLGDPSGLPPMSVRDVVERVGVSGRGVRRAAAAGHLVGSKASGGDWRFWPVDVDEWASQRRGVA